MFKEFENKYEGIIDGVYEDIDELPLKVTEVNGYFIEDIDYDSINKEEN